MNKPELELFRIAHEVLLDKGQVFEIELRNKDSVEAKVGTEYAIQYELYYGFKEKGYKTTRKGNRKQGGDIIVEDLVIEVESSIQKNACNYFIGAIEKHMRQKQKPDIFLIVSKNDVEECLTDWCNQNGYESLHRKLSPLSMLWLIKKK